MANEKVFSVRADEATIAKMNQIAEDSGMKKAEILPVLIAAWESNVIREALPGRSTEIDNVHNLLAQIERAYASSLELNLNAENRIRAEYETRLASSDQTVVSLKEAAEIAKSEASAAKAEAEAVAKERDQLLTDLAQARELIETKTESIEGLKAAKESIERHLVEVEAKLSDMPDTEERAKAAEAEVESLKRQMSEAEQEHEKKLWNLRNMNADAMNAQREKFTQKLDEFSERYNKLMKDMTAALAEARRKAEQAEDKAREKLEAALEKAEKRHETEIARLLARIEAIDEKEATLHDKSRNQKEPPAKDGSQKLK